MGQPKTQTNEEDMAEEVFKAQLRHTAHIINHSLTTERFTDDPGDYLYAALDLSTELQQAAMDGSGASILAAIERLDIDNFATDGVVQELRDFIDHLNETR